MKITRKAHLLKHICEYLGYEVTMCRNMSIIQGNIQRCHIKMQRKEHPQELWDMLDELVEATGELDTLADKWDAFEHILYASAKVNKNWREDNMDTLDGLIVFTRSMLQPLLKKAKELSTRLSTK